MESSKIEEFIGSKNNNKLIPLRYIQFFRSADCTVGLVTKHLSPIELHLGLNLIKNSSFHFCCSKMFPGSCVLVVYDGRFLKQNVFKSASTIQWEVQLKIPLEILIQCKRSVSFRFQRKIKKNSKKYENWPFPKNSGATSRYVSYRLVENIVSKNGGQ